MKLYEIWDVEAFRQIASFSDERSAAEWIHGALVVPLCPDIGRFSLIASSEEGDEVIASDEELVDYAIQQPKSAVAL